MRHHGLVAFTATVTILAPIVASRLTAGPKQEALAFAPGSRSLVVGKVGVEATLDKVIADPGETVQLHLEADRKVEVGIVMLGSTGTEGARVPNPPLGLLYKNITIDKPDGEHVAVDVPLKLKGAVTRSAFASYTIYVTTPAEAKRLDRLQRHATGPVSEGDEPGPPVASESGARLENALVAMDRDGDPEKLEAVDKQFPLGSVARLDAITRPASTRLAMAMPETVKPNVPFEVEVTVHNPSKKDDGVYIQMDPPSVAVDYRGIDPNDYVIEPKGESVSLAPHETKRLKFTVTAKTVGALALVAETYSDFGAAFGATEVTDEMPAPRYVLGTR